MKKGGKERNRVLSSGRGRRGEDRGGVKRREERIEEERRELADSLAVWQAGTTPPTCSHILPCVGNSAPNVPP